MIAVKKEKNIIESDLINKQITIKETEEKLT